MYPSDDKPGSIEAESPWFEYFPHDDLGDPAEDGLMDKPTALNACWQWLETVGLQWLADPTSKSADEWRREHNILVKGDA
jgi:hypothetical protein